MLILFFKSTPARSAGPGEEDPDAVVDKMRRILLLRVEEAETPDEKERAKQDLEAFGAI